MVSHSSHAQLTLRMTIFLLAELCLTRKEASIMLKIPKNFSDCLDNLTQSIHCGIFNPELSEQNTYQSLKDLIETHLPQILVKSTEGGGLKLVPVECDGRLINGAIYIYLKERMTVQFEIAPLFLEVNFPKSKLFYDVTPFEIPFISSLKIMLNCQTDADYCASQLTTDSDLYGLQKVRERYVVCVTNRLYPLFAKLIPSLTANINQIMFTVDDYI